MSEIDLTLVERCVEGVGSDASKTLELLQAVQGQYGYLPRQALERVCELTGIGLADVWGVATFYDQFRFTPAGRHRVRVCIGTACHVKGATGVYDAFRRYLKISEDEDTDAERMFTVEKVACLGCCMLAPAVQVGDVIYGPVEADNVESVLADFLRQQESAGQTEHLKQQAVVTGVGQLRICLDSSCVASGSRKVYDALKRAVHDTKAAAVVRSVGCPGMSYLAPIVDVVSADGRHFRYANVQPEDAKGIVNRHFKPGAVGSRLKNAVSLFFDKLLQDKMAEPVVRYSVDKRDRMMADYLDRQKHIATLDWGQMDPVSLDEYLGRNGFAALRECLEQYSSEQVIEQIQQSGLRGRGGGGFPTHLKWFAVHKAAGQTKYVVCNGDEGDPGAFMDRMLMESYPYRIIEGMAIAARTVGASQGYLYIRAEYPLACRRMAAAIEQCRERGYLGKHILGSDFSLTLKICAGAGAFVCGEETALLASIEGRRGMPRLRPPYPVEKGLWGWPTLVNNVETFVLVPWILRNGPEAFAELGTDGSKGTKVFALAGKIKRGGLVEVPMGMTIREIVEQIGGGIADGKQFKAVQIGGPSGGCVPAALADTHIDYESLHSVGAIMGSGGLVVLDEDDCMVDIARYFLEFTQAQSCGKCTFCRIGTKRMLEILERMCSGQGRKGDIERLLELGGQVQQNSICGLGKTAPNPVLSTIEHFRDEYEAHINGTCPAGKCSALIEYKITDDCIGCTLCAQHCPAEAITMTAYKKHEIDPQKCIRCGACKKICPVDAVIIE